ncbi:urea ABC transporter substrate-binding protein [Clostridium sp. LBM24168]
MKKIFSLITAIVVTTAIFTGCGGNSNSTDGKTIKLGVLEDQSGDFSLVGMQKYHAAQLAVQEINASGGVLGKKIEIVAPDTQSDNTKYQEMAKKLILDDKVAAIMGCYSSASREAVRPIVEQNNALLFYNNQYEGGVASHNVFCTGAVPEHQITTLINAMIKKFGPRVYTIAADYNFGQISAEWVKDTVSKNGGEIVGQEFIPLNVSQFSSTISNIQKAKPDVLVTLLIGTAQSSFYEQWEKTGIKGLPMASTVNLAQAYEHKRFKAPALANMYVTATYMEELNTSASNEFKKRWRKKFPKEPYIGMEAEAEYSGIYLWKNAVEKAGTTDVEKVIKALESGVSYDGPAGPVKIDGATHHAYRNVYLVRCDEKHNINFIQNWKSVAPNWLSSAKGIDLRKSSPNKQYTPIDK